MKITLTADDLLAMVRTKLQSQPFDIGFAAVRVPLEGREIIAELHSVSFEIDLTKAGSKDPGVAQKLGSCTGATCKGRHRNTACGGNNAAPGCAKCNPVGFGFGDNTILACPCAAPVNIPEHTHVPYVLPASDGGPGKSVRTADWEHGDPGVNHVMCDRCCHGVSRDPKVPGCNWCIPRNQMERDLNHCPGCPVCDAAAKHPGFKLYFKKAAEEAR